MEIKDGEFYYYIFVDQHDIVPTIVQYKDPTLEDIQSIQSMYDKSHEGSVTIIDSNELNYQKGDIYRLVKSWVVGPVKKNTKLSQIREYYPEYDI